MKKLLMVFGLGLFALGLTACANAEAYEAYVTVDINPSVGFVVNEQNVVKTAYALNEDGEMLLLQLQLEEKNFEDAVEEIIDESMDLGFIDVDAESTTIEIDAVGETEKITERVRTMVQERIAEKMSERALSANVRTRTYSQAEQDEAGNKGVSPVQYRLMKQAMELDPDLTEEEALNVDAKGLIARMRNNPEARGIAREIMEEFLAAKKAIHDEYIPQIKALEDQIAAATANTEDTSALEAELQALKDEMHAELMAVVQTKITESAALRVQLQTQHQARIAEHQARVEQYRQGIQEQNKTTNASGTGTGKQN